MKREDLSPCENYEATYCPEDDKLRLYVGRVPREEYEYLRAEGWTSTPKQSCDFVAVWTPSREKTAIQYAGFVGDEDTPPTERAADRAERFSGYREKREGEAVGHADRFDSQPLAHGFQSVAKAERATVRHDRIADKAADQWSKAEYWQRRTAGVIRHAMYKSSPAVRMGRIKVLEAELRKLQAGHDEYAKRYRSWQKLAAMEDTESQNKLVRHFAGSGLDSFMHPRPETVTNAHIQREGSSLWTLMGMVESGYGSDDITGKEACEMWLTKHGEPAGGDPWTEHLKLRLAYEHQMLEAQGGRAAMVEMEVGGWLGSHQIRKINKSNATGRVVSVGIMLPTNGKNRWGNPDPTAPPFRMEIINIERLAQDVYRPPTDEERAAFAAETAAAKKKTATAAKEKAAKGENCPLINPTDEDAERLQALWNDEAAKDRWFTSNGGKPSEVLRMTQEQYAAHSKGAHARCGTVTVCEKGTEHERRSGEAITRHDVFKIRTISNGFAAKRVIVLTDKPQKTLPWAALEAAKAKCPTVEKVIPHLPEIARILGKSWTSPEENRLVRDAEYCNLAYVRSQSQKGLTEKGAELLKKQQILQTA